MSSILHIQGKLYRANEAGSIRELPTFRLDQAIDCPGAWNVVDNVQHALDHHRPKSDPLYDRLAEVIVLLTKARQLAGEADREALVRCATYKLSEVLNLCDLGNDAAEDWDLELCPAKRSTFTGRRTGGWAKR